jgi:hypothetical protein
MAFQYTHSQGHSIALCTQALLHSLLQKWLEFLQLQAIGGSQETCKQGQYVIRTVMPDSIDICAVAEYLSYPLKRHTEFLASTM